MYTLCALRFCWKVLGGRAAVKMVFIPDIFIIKLRQLRRTLLNYSLSRRAATQNEITVFIPIGFYGIYPFALWTQPFN